MRNIKVDTKPYGFKLYNNKYFKFEPGITCFVGCNGSGKSTLIKLIKDELKKLKIPVFMYDNIISQNKRSFDLEYGSASSEMLHSTLLSNFLSEGEQILDNLKYMMKSLGSFVRTNIENKEKEIWIIIDGIDSGTSLDVLQDLKVFFADYILKDSSDSFKIFIVLSANSYELAREVDCIDVQSSKHLMFHTYEDYQEFVIKSRKIKDSQD